MTAPSVQDMRPVVLLLSTVYVEAAARYVGGWSDDEVARRCGVGTEVVRHTREVAFGAGERATAGWRLRQAIELVAQHFDHTRDLEARDRIAAEVGAGAMRLRQLWGEAAAGGRWDEGWGDDRVAELAGVDSGLVHAIRESIPWTPPELRPVERLLRLLARLDPATRAGRVLRLAAELDPRTGELYTAPAIVEALVAAGEPPLSPRAHQRDLDRIETMIRVMRARVDPTTGEERSLRATAAAVGLSHQGVAKIINQIERGDMTPEGRPSLLTAEICERVEAALPRRVDHRSIFKWLIGWIWLMGGAPPALRTIKGWRAAGAEDIAAGAVDSLPARFELAVRYLLARAPAGGPELPTVAEIEATGLKARAAADALGVTLEQVKQVREFEKRAKRRGGRS